VPIAVMASGKAWGVRVVRVPGAVWCGARLSEAKNRSWYRA
jgi:hypothetical protein